MSKPSSKSNKNVWKGIKSQAEVHDLLKKMEFLLGRISVEAGFHDYTLEDDYGELFTVVEKLYNVLDLGGLAQDNARRNKEWKARVKQ